MRLAVFDPMSMRRLGLAFYHRPELGLLLLLLALAVVITDVGSLSELVLSSMLRGRGRID